MGMVIHKLIDGIVAKFVATSALTTAFTANAAGPFREVAVGSPAMPYVVLEVPPAQADLEDAYGDVTSDEIVLFFKVIGLGHDATAAKMATLIGVYDHTTLTLSGATNIGMFRNGPPVPTRLLDDPSGGDVWQWAVAYTYQVQ